MSLVSDLHAARDISSPPNFGVARAEYDPDAIAPPHGISTSPEPAILPPNRRENAQDSVSFTTGSNASSDVPLSIERGNKAAWGKPSNAAIDAAPLVLGNSSSWPALSQSAKSKPSTDHPSSGSSSSLLKFSNRGGGNNGDDVGSSSSNGEPSSSSSTSSAAEISQNNADKQSVKGNYSNWEYHPRDSHGWVDQGDRRRRHVGGGRRGNYGNRRDNWNSYRPLNMRDSQMQRVHPSMQLMRPHMPTMVPFYGPPTLFQHFPGPMNYTDIPPQLYFLPTYPYSEPFGGYPFVPQPAPPAIQQPAFFAYPEQKRTLIMKQIEYYFSSDNLINDSFLKSNMDDHGWVPIHVIADFNRIKLLTESIPFILDAIRPSDVLEVEGNRVRKRDGWQIWINSPRQNQSDTESEPSSQATTNHESLVSRMEAIAVNEGGNTDLDEAGSKQTLDDPCLSYY